MMNHKRKLIGFTLFEMLLVLVIITSVLLMIMTYLTTKTDETRRDKTAMQIEQILNAALAYYVNNSKWPGSQQELSSAKYLSPTTNPGDPNTMRNPWGRGFVVISNPTTGTFSVCTSIGTGARNSSADAKIIASRVPLGYVGMNNCAINDNTYVPSTTCTTDCAVVSTVNIPGQNLNNARSLNFAGLYHNGACVPAPSCPLSMTPAIFVVPAQVTGNNDGDSNVYPLSSFTAYAYGKSDVDSTPDLKPYSCTLGSQVDCYENDTGAKLTDGTYWRVCLDVVTEKGRLSGPTWKSTSGTILAVTRCVPNGEPVGSSFDVFQHD